MIKKIIVFILLGVFFLPTIVLAEGKLGDAATGITNIGGAAGYDTESKIETTIGTVINIALSLVGMIFLVLTVYAGILWMTARGEEAQAEKAKKILTNSIIGLVLTVSAYAITFLVTSRLSQ
jgi:hypothetical protein